MRKPVANEFGDSSRQDRRREASQHWHWARAAFPGRRAEHQRGIDDLGEADTVGHADLPNPRTRANSGDASDCQYHGQPKQQPASPTGEKHSAALRCRNVECVERNEYSKKS